MTVYLLRHGIAEDSSSSGRDADRELTEDGRERLSEVLHRAQKAGVKPDVILTSPYKRAMQTAKIAAKILDGPEPERQEDLHPHANPRGLWILISDHRRVDQLLIASHEPLLSHAVAFLLNSPGLQIEMKKAAMVALEFSRFSVEPQSVLQWMLTPKVCA